MTSDDTSRRMRRIDFRFLMADARLDNVGHAATDELVAALEGLRAGTVGPLSAAGEHDLVVLSDPSRSTLEKASRGLRPGGACYVEWNMARPGGTLRARRLLGRAGFSDIEMYWHWPSFRRAQPLYWLGLDGRAAADFMGSRPPAGLRAQLARLLWRACRATGTVAPLAVLAWRRDGDRPPATLREHLANRQLDVLGDARAEELAVSILTGGHSDLNKAVILVSRHGPLPLLAIKAARTPTAEIGLRHEAAAITDVQLSGRLRSPRLAFDGRLGATYLVGQSFVSGTAITELAPEQLEAAALELVDHLAALAHGAPLVAPEVWWPRLVEPLLADIRPLCPERTHPALDRLAAATRHLPPLPLVPEHRDCSPWNILCDDVGNYVLVDWESAEPEGLPALDVIYFLANVRFLRDGTLRSGREPGTYASERHLRLFRQGVERYASAVGIAWSALDLLRALTWAVHTAGEIRRARTNEAGAEWTPHGSVMFRLLEIELAQLPATAQG
jgi:hypothetical protein